MDAPQPSQLNSRQQLDHSADKQQASTNILLDQKAFLCIYKIRTQSS